MVVRRLRANRSPAARSSKGTPQQLVKSLAIDPANLVFRTRLQPGILRYNWLAGSAIFWEISISQCLRPQGVRICLAHLMASRYMWCGETAGLATWPPMTLWRAASGAEPFRAGPSTRLLAGLRHLPARWRASLQLRVVTVTLIISALVLAAVGFLLMQQIAAGFL